MSKNTKCDKCPKGFEVSSYMDGTQLCPFCGIMLKPKLERESIGEEVERLERMGWN